MIPRLPPSPYMIEIVSMNTLSARDPDQSAITKPMETMSKRPPSNTSVRVCLMTSLTTSEVRTCGGAVDDALLHLLDHVGADPVAEIADRPDQPQQQRRQGEQGEEARFSGQPCDAVAEADRGGLADQMPDDPAGTGARAPAGSVGANDPAATPSTVGHVSAATHEVTNQPHRWSDHDVLATRRRSGRSSPADGGAGAVGGVTPLGLLAGTEQAQRWGDRGQREPARAAHPRPLRRPRRRGRLPPRLARAARRGVVPRAARRAVGATGAPRRTRAPRGRLRGLVAGRGRARLPGLDDVRRRAGAARRPGAGRASGSPG